MKSNYVVPLSLFGYRLSWIGASVRAGEKTIQQIECFLWWHIMSTSSFSDDLLTDGFRQDSLFLFTSDSVSSSSDTKFSWLLISYSVSRHRYTVCSVTISISASVLVLVFSIVYPGGFILFSILSTRGIYPNYSKQKHNYNSNVSVRCFYICLYCTSGRKDFSVDLRCFSFEQPCWLKKTPIGKKCFNVDV